MEGDYLSGTETSRLSGNQALSESRGVLSEERQSWLQGELVAVAGNGTMDRPALHEVRPSP